MASGTALGHVDKTRFVWNDLRRNNNYDWERRMVCTHRRKEYLIALPVVRRDRSRGFATRYRQVRTLLVSPQCARRTRFSLIVDERASSRSSI